MSLGVFTSVIMSMLVFWIPAQCRFVRKYQPYGGITASIFKVEVTLKTVLIPGRRISTTLYFVRTFIKCSLLTFKYRFRRTYNVTRFTSLAKFANVKYPFRRTFFLT